MKLPRLARLASLSIVFAVSLLLGACHRDEQPPWQLSDISGHMPDLTFQLTNDEGKTVTAADYHGKIALLYFGYTHCPDVCPLTLAHLHVVMQKLGKPADNVRILFVSVDPTRDTPAVMHDYVKAFDPRVVGLTGSATDIEALTKRYRAAFSREPGAADGSYEVSHSSGIYIFDANGKARLLATPADAQDKIVHDLQLMLGSGNAS
jgi:protein SCO1